MFDRKDLLQSKEYWLTRIQTKLFALLENYMEERGLNQTQLAKELGVTKGYVSQVLNGNFDHRMSKFVELSLAINKVPQIHFEEIDQVLDDDELGLLYEEDRMSRPIINLIVGFEPYQEKIDYSKRKVQHEKSKEISKGYSTTIDDFQSSESEPFLS